MSHDLTELGMPTDAFGIPPAFPISLNIRTVHITGRILHSTRHHRPVIFPPRPLIDSSIIRTETTIRFRVYPECPVVNPGIARDFSRDLSRASVQLQAWHPKPVLKAVNESGICTSCHAPPSHHAHYLTDHASCRTTHTDRRRDNPALALQFISRSTVPDMYGICMQTARHNPAIEKGKEHT